eukprot:m.65053 g.65053  ORF g.65053 m.65053 type:complete len:449 (-) comp19603_c0_seq4:276-1622(-)
MEGLDSSSPKKRTSSLKRTHSQQGRGKSVANIGVLVRVRPLLPHETDAICVETHVEGRANHVKLLLDTHAKLFEFDHVLDPTVKQQELYAVAVPNLLSKFLAGYNTSIFAYGQTGSGKTWSLLGDESNDDSSENFGIFRRFLTELFDIRHEQTELDFDIRLSVLEIYNDTLRDLLDEKKRKKRDAPVIREGKDTGLFVEGLHNIKIKNATDAGALLLRAQTQRVTGDTKMNSRSSRSHMVLTITLEQKAKDPQHDPTGVHHKISTMRMIDLAGSERAEATEASGKQRADEGAHINQSLLELGNCINALVQGDKYVPFRNCKLTRLLQSSLGGNTATVMIATVSPCKDNQIETLSTLRFADRAKQIRTTAAPVTAKQTPLQLLQEENARLKARVHALEFRPATNNQATQTEIIRSSSEFQSMTTTAVTERTSLLQGRRKKKSCCSCCLL